MSADVLVHCDELIWKRRWLNFAYEYRDSCKQVFSKPGPQGS